MYLAYSSAFVGNAFSVLDWPILGSVPLLLDSLNRSCGLTSVIILEIWFLRLGNIAHIERHSGLVAFRVITISVQGAVVTVLVLHGLVQVLVNEVELRRLFADVIFGNRHANQMNLKAINNGNENHPQLVVKTNEVMKPGGKRLQLGKAKNGECDLGSSERFRIRRPHQRSNRPSFQRS